MDEVFIIEDGVLLRYAGGGEERVRVPDGVTALGEYAFARCETVTEILLPEGVEEIGEYAFMGCSGLARAVLPSTLRRIGQAAFRGCGSLTEADIPAGVAALPRSCFYECISLKSVVLPDGLRTVGSKAFSGCTDLEEIVFGSGLVSLEEFAFESCQTLRSILLPEGLLHIGRHAFSGCHKLSEVVIPHTVAHIGCSALYHTAFLERAEGFVIAGDGILVACKSRAERLSVPDGVKQIGELSFAYNDVLRGVTLPESVTELCPRAFERCTALEDIELPQSLRVIGDRAFADCSSLADILLPDNIEVIGEGAFDRTPIVPPGNTEMVMLGRYLIAAGEDAAALPQGAEIVAGGAFSGNELIRTLSLGGVRSVGNAAFRWCRELTAVNIPRTAEYIGSYAFSGCDKLTVRMERGRRRMGENAFEAGQLITFYDSDGEFTVCLLNGLAFGSPEHALMGFAAEPSESRFLQLYYPEYMIPAAVCFNSRGGAYSEYLRENIVTAVRFAVDNSDSSMLESLLSFGYLTERQSAECAAYAIEREAFEQQLMIMRCRQNSFGSVTEAAIDNKFDW